ncbi:MAG: hypothetical protein DMG97_05725, partial [Acidobacteria bacterium]
MGCSSNIWRFSTKAPNAFGAARPSKTNATLVERRYNHQRPDTMISEDEARAKILETIQRLSTRQIPLADALDCFTAEDCFARLPLPNFDNSAMDGYAVVASSCARGKRLRVVGEQPAGLDRQLRVGAGEAVRIFTGAPMPDGADAVVMQEDVMREGSEILLNVDVNVGEFVRRRG